MNWKGIGLAATGLAGGALGVHLLHAINSKVAVKKMFENHPELESWGDEAKEIADFALNLAPNLSNSPEALYDVVNRIREAGGPSYATAITLASLGDVANRSNLAPSRLRDFFESSRKLSGNSRGMKKTSAINPYIAFPAAFGAGFSLPFLLHFGEKAISNIKAKHRWKKTLEKYPELENIPEAERYFEIINSVAPKLSDNPATVASFIKHMDIQRGSDINTISTLYKADKSARTKEDLAYRYSGLSNAILSTLGGF